MVTLSCNWYQSVSLDPSLDRQQLTVEEKEKDKPGANQVFLSSQIPTVFLFLLSLRSCLSDSCLPLSLFLTLE